MLNRKSLISTLLSFFVIMAFILSVTPLVAFADDTPEDDPASALEVGFGRVAMTEFGFLTSGDIVEAASSLKTVIISETELSAEQIRAINDANKSSKSIIKNVQTNTPVPMTANLADWEK